MEEGMKQTLIMFPTDEDGPAHPPDIPVEKPPVQRSRGILAIAYNG
jgi:hypothetical protein